MTAVVIRPSAIARPKQRILQHMENHHLLDLQSPQDPSREHSNTRRITIYQTSSHHKAKQRTLQHMENHLLDLQSPQDPSREHFNTWRITYQTSSHHKTQAENNYTASPHGWLSGRVLGSCRKVAPRSRQLLSVLSIMTDASFSASHCYPQGKKLQLFLTFSQSSK